MENKPKKNNEQEKFQLTVVDASRVVKEQARMAGDEAMSQSGQEKVKFWQVGKFLKQKVWKQNLMKEYYRQKEIKGAEKKILKEQNIYANEDGVEDAAHDKSINAIVDRFSSEYYNDLVDTEGGESVQVIEASDEVKAEIKDFIAQYIKKFDPEATEESRDMYRQSQKEESKRRVTSLIKEGKIENNDLKNALLHESNLMQIAEQVRNSADSEAALESLRQNLEIRVGEARSALRSEAHKNSFDKVQDWMEKKGVSSLVNETTLAVGASIATAAITRGMHVGARLAMVPGAGMLVGGVFAGLKESKNLKKERAQHMRDMAVGKEYEPDAKKRNEMQEYIHETVPAATLIADIEAAEGNEAAMQSLAAAESRLRLNSQKRIDLVSYSSVADAEEEMKNLRLAVARKKVELRNENPEFDEVYSKVVKVDKKGLLKEIGINDKEFRGYKNKKALWKGLKFGAISGLVGGVVQESIAGVSSSQYGLIDQVRGVDAPGEGASQTTLSHLLSNKEFGGTTLSTEMVEGIAGNDHVPAGFENSTLRLPDGFYCSYGEQGGNQVFSIINSQGETVGQNIPLEFGNEGMLSDNAYSSLKEQGIDLNRSTFAVGETIANGTSTAEQFLANHESLDVKRDLWFDNETTISDGNEVETHWGGENATGIDANGNYVLSVAQMTEGGSYNGALSADAQELMKNGKLSMLLSLTSGTQSQVIEIPIDASGSAVIDPESDIGKAFFATKEDGRAQFLGKYAEVAQKMGLDENGVTQIQVLSTVVGKGSETVSTSVKEATVNGLNTFIIPKEVITAAQITPTVDPIIPGAIQGRNPIEGTRNAKKEEVLDNELAPDTDEQEEQEQVPVLLSQREYSNIKNDIEYINTAIQEGRGIIELNEKALFSEYGRKRYEELKKINPTAMPVKGFNPEEIRSLGDEFEKLLMNAKIEKKAESKVAEDNTISRTNHDGLRKDIDYINRSVQEGKGILEIDKEKLQSRHARERYEELKKINPTAMPVKSFNPKELRALGDEVEELLSKSTVREGGDIQLEKIPNLVESDLTKEQLKNMKDDFILINKLIFVDKLNVADINLDTINSEYAKRSIEQLKAEKYNVGPKLLQLRSNMESILIEKEDMSRGDSKELITEMLSDELVKIKTELRDTEKKQKEGGEWRDKIDSLNTKVSESQKYLDLFKGEDQSDRYRDQQAAAGASSRYRYDN